MQRATSPLAREGGAKYLFDRGFFGVAVELQVLRLRCNLDFVIRNRISGGSGHRI